MGICIMAAIYELIDNAIDANAENINIHIEYNEVDDDDEYIRVYVEDDGYGISKTKTVDGIVYDGITYALAFGDSYDRGANAIGKFGWGLPASATCTSLRTEVYTRTSDDDEWRYTYVDLDEMDEKNNTRPPIASTEVPDHLDLVNPNPESGTVVSFDKCDDTEPKTVRGIKGRLIKNVSRIYRDFLDGGLNITVNGTEVEPTDPLYMMENARNVGELPDKVPQVEEPFHNKKVELESTDTGETHDVEITVVMLDVEAIRKSDAYDQNWMKEHNLNTTNQGFSIVRNGREIRNDLTLDLFTKHPNKNFMRAEVRFPPELDERFGIQSDKSRLSVKQSTKDKLKEGLANTPDQIHNKTNRIRNKIKAEENKKKSDAEPSPSEEAAEKGAKFLKDARDQTEEELEEIKKDVEKRKDQELAEIEEDDNLDEEEKEDKKQRVEKKYERQKKVNSHNVTTETIGTGHFYEADFRGNQVNAIINDRHRFYDIYKQLTVGAHNTESTTTDGGSTIDLAQTQESMLIDHLLLAAARAELMMGKRAGSSDSEEIEEIIFQFRSEWSEALRTFLKFADTDQDNRGPIQRN